LGALYSVQGHYPQAIYWYRLAAKKGNAHAQFNLGLLYELGRGLPKDLEKAQDCYKLAAAQGHWDAQYKLARLNDDDLPPLPSSP
jgi:TPR repeat protein